MVPKFSIKKWIHIFIKFDKADCKCVNQYHLSKVFQFLLASGDLQHWLIVEKSEIIGDTGDKLYSGQAIPIIASSISCDPYSSIWYRRSGSPEDPWVSVRNHNDPAGELMLYGQSGSAGHNTALQNSGGMDVFIRKLGI